VAAQPRLSRIGLSFRRVLVRWCRDRREPAAADRGRRRSAAPACGVLGFAQRTQRINLAHSAIVGSAARGFTYPDPHADAATGENGQVSTPEQHRPPVYACAAGAVLHAHSASTLEPAVLLYTFLPAGAGDWLDALEARVDVHGDGPGSSTVTVRVLSEGQALSWQLPLAPFVAALPGQPGDDGRMVLLGVVDAEPEHGFWAEPVDCERLAAELQLPVGDLVDALRGRLTPWLADDVDILLHDDAHEHAADRSPAQTLASAVLAHYRGDLAAEQATTRLVRALELAPEQFQVELGGRLCVALVAALEIAGPAAVQAVLAQTGPFEPEVVRLLTDLPPRLRAQDPKADDARTAAEAVLAGEDHDEAVRAAVSIVARLARQALGTDLADEDLLQRLSMVDDAGLARLAGLWVDLAAASAGAGERDEATVADLAARVTGAGAPAAAWLRTTAAGLASSAAEVAGRGADRLAAPVHAVRSFLDQPVRPGEGVPKNAAGAVLQACLVLARFARARGGLGPGAWLHAPVDAAARAVGTSLAAGLDRELALDLLGELLETDVEAPDLIEAFVCATSQLLVELDPQEAPELLRAQVAELLGAVPAGASGARWLLTACLREAPEHDPAAADLTPLLSGEPTPDVDRQARRAGRRGMLDAGLAVLEALSATFGEPVGVSREEVLSLVLPGALSEHDLLLRSE